MRQTILIDCDPGIDDAVMLMMALAATDLHVAAITTVAGNVPLDKTSRNARLICELMGRRDVPVFAGCPRPILRPPVTAEAFHGEEGLDGIPVQEPALPLAQGHAVNQLISALGTAPPASRTLIVTGPMTNIAAALIMAPEIAENVRNLIVMAGADSEGGNITPFAEYNVFADPHAAAVVFAAPLPITVLSLDVTHTVRAEPQRLERLRGGGSERALLVADLLEAANRLEQRWKPGLMAPMHDPSTIAYLLRPEMFSGHRCKVSVDTLPGEQFGQTRIVRDTGGPHFWVTDSDADGFFALIETLMAAP